ncbi:long-chain fatty acid--CoA ligase [Persicimonas caeni]|uniref:Long-chain fatty acid--CoA ligase n=1 Tax=Persicimonas caeni TaxID=2292766 RepID=A0A4Y6PS85_PERCE|nr:AMP-binding protein [Persicimonas caeni]QDG51181.1 long-chain fatty acid--CoA ligase [Persicimonas caeni]QED32402.1 long-chain fatty acid--CoA ligase [Persicimonas caeni]
MLLSSDWLKHHAHTRPDKIALIEPERQVTYAELWRMTKTRAAQLAGLDIGAGDRVAALMPNRIALVTLQAACALRGAVFVPLNHRLAPVELAAVIEDADPAVMFYEMRTATLAFEAALSSAVMLIDADVPLDDSVTHMVADTLASPTDAPAGPETPALIVYTSGSTGTPRGAVHTHANLLWNHAQFLQELPFGADDINYAAAPMFHVAGLNVLTWPLLLAGGTSILVPSFQPDLALAHIRDSGATCAFMVPTMWRALLDSLSKAEADSGLAQSMGKFKGGVVGGAPCPPELIRAWAEHDVTLMQGYGMTEAGPMATLLGPRDAVEHAGSVGVPGEFVDVRIVDDEGRDVAPGEAGELILRGPNVMKGYWRNPQATARALRCGWFHSGDIARQDADGRYTIVGRRRDMIITGGENVYPAEVERVLGQMPGVAEAAVFGVDDDFWGEQVCCAVVPEEDDAGDEISLEAIVAFCSQSLARYKCPRRLFVVDELPRNGAGKVLRDELRSLPDIGTFEEAV